MGSVAKLKFKEHKEDLVKLEIGSWDGRATPDGFIQLKEATRKWPHKDASIDEAECDFLLQFLTMQERVFLFNELYRVLKPGGKCRITTPHWCAAKAYGHPGVQWPPVSEYFFPMLNKKYRDEQRWPEKTGLTCNFECGSGYGMHPEVVARHTERQMEQLKWHKEAAQDLIVTVTKV